MKHNKPYIKKQIDLKDIKDKELVKCKCGNTLFDQKIQFYKFIDNNQVVYATQVVNVCTNCYEILPDKP